MASSKPVKWSVSSEEPDDLQEFLTNDEIEDKHGLPRKGIYRLRLRQVVVGKIKNGDNAGKDRLRVMLIIDEPKKSDKAKWNQFVVWDGLNVTEQGKPFVKRFLKAIGLTWSDFINKSRIDKQEPPHLVQIAGVKIESGDVFLKAMLREKSDDYGDTVEPARYIMPEDDDEPDDDEPEEDEDDDEVEVMDESEGEDEEDEESEDDEDDEEDPEDELREELSALNKADLERRLKKSAKKALVKDYVMPKTKSKLVDMIVEIELREPPF